MASQQNQKMKSTKVLLVALALSGVVVMVDVFVALKTTTRKANSLREIGEEEMIVESIIGNTVSVSTESQAPPNLNANIDPQIRINHFKDTALSLRPVTDKIGYGKRDRHRYHNMYGQFLLPLATYKPNLKFLEIGLGCNMQYGAGASVKLWKKLLPSTAELWEAEYDKNCADKAQAAGQLDGINVLVGDQGDVKVLDSWIEKSGGQFDIVIDDGGHHNCQIMNTFEKLWPQLNPGGYYFIEDLHLGVARLRVKSDQCTNVPFHKYLDDWQNQLIYQTFPGQVQPVYTLPKDLMFVHCQTEACVLHKRKDDVNLAYADEPGTTVTQY